MFNRKEIKRKAQSDLKKHYLIFMVACLLASYLGTAYITSLASFGATTLVVDRNENNNILEPSFGNFTIDDVLESLYEGKLEQSKDISNQLDGTVNEGTKIGAIELGRRNGVLSSLVNKLSSGQIFIIVFETINSIIKSKEVTTIIFIILAALLVLSVTILVKDLYLVAYRRVFLEGYAYEKVRVSRFLFLFRVKRFFKAAWAMFVTNFFQYLWDITIIGGIVKRYSYSMVPYIVAENPDIGALDAINLSRRMMYGHKLESFKIDLSLIGYDILGILTLGISELFYSNPYRECIYMNYYVYLRQDALNRGISYIGYFNDKYLFEKADAKLVEDTYSDVVDIMIDDIDVRDLKHRGFRGFIENNFGVIYKYDEDEDLYNIAIEQEEKIDEYKYILDLKQYPERLFPMPLDKRNPRLEHVHYLRHYYIWSVVAMFFIFCFVGWTWEVSIHLVKDGVFVNRGVNHGPWLPIYGTGCTMILLFLFKFRNRPALEAGLTITLCGIVEYFTHLYLELTKGIKWWDYTGYFLNINGRICAEGLLVFMIGGVAVVYALAPIIDNLLRKINRKVLMVVCIILLTAFAVDVVYSSFHPNTGAGITDYDNTSYVIRKVDHS